jgi:hypothetical protein
MLFVLQAVSQDFNKFLFELQAEFLLHWCHERENVIFPAAFNAYPSCQIISKIF